VSYSWAALHAHLLSVTARQKHASIYENIRRTTDGLPPGDIGSLLTTLHDPVLDPAEKNEALRTLVAAAQAEDFSETATTILLLALWPGLDAVRSRLRRDYSTSVEHLDGELVGRLTCSIRTLNHGSVDRIAATLLRNAERDVRRYLARVAREAPGTKPLDEVAGVQPLEPVFSGPAPDFDDDRARLAGRLRAVIGRDGDLVVAVAIDGETQCEVAERMGLSHDAVRKRYQRACSRLREIW
jgi:hypothetical protein